MSKKKRDSVINPDEQFNLNHKALENISNSLTMIEKKLDESTDRLLEGQKINNNEMVKELSKNIEVSMKNLVTKIIENNFNEALRESLYAKDSIFANALKDHNRFTDSLLKELKERTEEDTSQFFAFMQEYSSLQNERLREFREAIIESRSSGGDLLNKMVEMIKEEILKKT